MKKLIILLAILITSLIVILSITVISTSDSSVNNDSTSANESSKSNYTNDQVSTLKSSYKTVINDQKEAIDLLKANSTFESYKADQVSDDYFIINVQSKSKEEKKYIVYPSGIYMTITDDIVLKNDGVVSTPEIGVMIALDLMGSKLNDDYSFHITQLEDAYQIDVVSKSKAKANQDSVIASYAISYDGSYFLAI